MTILIHREMPMGFEAWKEAVEMPELEPASIDKFDSGPLMLEAAAHGLGVALMHASHYHQAKDSRLVRLFDVSVKSPYRRSEEHTSELQALMRISYAVFFLNKQQNCTQPRYTL